MDKQKNNNSEKQKNSQLIWPGLIGIVVFVSTIVSVILASTLNLSSDVLLQFIFLAIGCGVSYWVGRTSVRKAAEEIVKPHAKSAFRRLGSLYDNLSRAATVIQSGQVSDSHENYQVTLARLEEIVATQLITADHALEDWNDIVPDEVEELKQRLQSDSTEEDEQ